MLIPWLKTVWKMDTLGSQNVEWKFGKRPIYSCRAHIATSFVPVATVTGRADCRVDLEFQGTRDIRLTVCESQVSGLIIMHRNRFPICGQGRYGGLYRGFEGFLGRMWAHMHGRFSGRRAYVHAYPLNNRAFVRVRGNLRRALGARL
jgi:hypothetical protein